MCTIVIVKITSHHKLLEHQTIRVKKHFNWVIEIMTISATSFRNTTTDAGIEKPLNVGSAKSGDITGSGPQRESPSTVFAR